MKYMVWIYFQQINIIPRFPWLHIISSVSISYNLIYILRDECKARMIVSAFPDEDKIMLSKNAKNIISKRISTSIEKDMEAKNVTRAENHRRLMINVCFKAREVA
uniref:Uncharacterized protein n=1 Tax=Glossina brevipalpis TaxID=37001 RepID=A0A1A9WRI0_9MUSC